MNAAKMSESIIVRLCLQRLPIQNLHLKLTREWSAQVSNHRSNVRCALKQHFLDRTGASREDLSVLRDLAKVPRFSNYSISISHCPTLGGFTVHRGVDYQIGLDVEQRSRIRREIVARICDPNELNGGPEPSFFWCAKESLFKSRLGMKQTPKVLSDLRIEGWQKIADEAYLFHGLLRQNNDGIAGLGVVLSFGENILAIACAAAEQQSRRFGEKIFIFNESIRYE